MGFQFFDVFQNAAAGIAIMNLDGSFRFVNSQFCDITGYPEKELQQMTFIDITHPDDLELDMAYVDQVMAGDIDTYEIEKRYVHKDGHPVWVHLHISVKRDADRQVEYVIATVIDISEKKAAEQQQHMDRLRFHSMFEENPAGILLLQVTGSRAEGTDDLLVKAVNPALAQIFQVPAEAVVGKPLTVLYPEVRAIHIYQMALTVHESQETRRLPTSVFAYQDLYIWFNATIAPLPTGELMVVVNDVTREVEARNQIVQERDRAQQYFDIAGVMLLILDTRGRIMDINQAGARILGGTKNELIAMDWFRNFIFPQDREEIEKIFQEVVHGNIEYYQRAEGRIINRQGQERYIAWTNTYLRDDQGEIYGTLSSGEDITDQRKRIRELELLNKVVENSLNGFDIVNQEGLFTFVNKAYIEMWGYDSAEEIIGTSPTIHCLDPSVPDQLTGLLEDDGHCILEFKGLKKDGSTFDVLMYAWADEDTSGNRVYVGTSIDISPRKQYEADLENSREQLRQLANHIQDAREAERQHLSREMHDEFGQILSGLKMDLSWLRRHISLEKPVENRLEGMNGLIDQAIQVTRRISHDLRPGILDDLGLFAALEWYSEEFTQRSGIPVTLSLPEEDPPMRPEVVTAFFRIYQEALTNVYRHAEATTVEAALKVEQAMISLSIQDNGKGMPENGQQEEQSFGLLGMHERANMLGGHVEIVSQPGEGTRITADIPAAFQGSP